MAHSNAGISRLSGFEYSVISVQTLISDITIAKELPNLERDWPIGLLLHLYLYLYFSNLSFVQNL